MEGIFFKVAQLFNKFLSLREPEYLSQSTITSTNAIYFLSMSNNPTYDSAALKPSSGVQGHVHFNIAAETYVGLINVLKK
jgi:hypothetical protein